MYFHHLPLYFVSKANIPPRGQEGQTWTTEPAQLIQYSLSISACSFAFTSFVAVFSPKFLRRHFRIPDFVFCQVPDTPLWHRSWTCANVDCRKGDYRVVCVLEARRVSVNHSLRPTIPPSSDWSTLCFMVHIYKNGVFISTSVRMCMCISVHTFMHSFVRVFVSTPFRPERHESSLLRVSLLWPVDRGGPSQKYAHL